MTGKELVLYCDHVDRRGAEGPVGWLGRWPILWFCNGCGDLKLDKKEQWSGAL